MTRLPDTEAAVCCEMLKTVCDDESEHRFQQRCDGRAERRLLSMLDVIANDDEDCRAFPNERVTVLP